NTNYLYTQYDVIRSAPVMELAIRQAKAEDMEMFKGVTSRISWLKRNFSVDIARGDQVFSLELDGPNIDETVTLLGAISDCYHQTQAQAEGGMIDQKTHTYKTEKDRVDQQLEIRQKQLDDLQKMQTAAVMGGQNATMSAQRAGAMSNALTQAQLD